MRLTALIKEAHIPRISLISSVAIVLLLTLTLGSVMIHEKKKGYRKHLAWIDTTYKSQHRQQLKSDVRIQVHNINGFRQQAENRLKQELEQRVTEAHAQAARLYEIYKGRQPPEMVRRLILETLGTVRYNRGRGYFFILDLKGRLLLYPPDRAWEGQMPQRTLFLDWPGLTRRMIRKARENGQGFVKYQWTKPGHDALALFPKITFVKRFAPFDWIIGTGEYLDLFEAEMQKAIAGHFNALPPDPMTHEYLFIYEVHNIRGGHGFATMRANPNHPDLVGKKLSDQIKDPTGFMYRRAMLKGIREKGEAFVTYWYKKPGEAGVHAKLSYFKYLPQWQWIVGKGIYMNDLEDQIAALKADLNREIQEALLFLALFLVLVCAIFLALAYFFSRAVASLFDGYKKTQQAYREDLEYLNTILEKKASTDPLTQLYNRSVFNSQILKETARANRYQTGLGLIIFDVDEFKQINDSHGHLIGDQVLKQIAGICRKNIRSQDILARWGGEEFVLLVPENPEQAAAHLAEKLRQLIAAHKYPLPGQVTCSFGVTAFRPGEDNDAFITRADQALYRSKQAGRNRVTAL